jgi:hypothetical protein
MVVRILEIWPGLTMKQLREGLGITEKGHAQFLSLLRSLHPAIHATGEGFWVIHDMSQMGWGWIMQPMKLTGQQAARTHTEVALEMVWPSPFKTQ